MSSFRVSHQFVINVSAPADLPKEKVRCLLGKLIDIGLADVASTIEEGEGDLESCELITDLNISSPAVLEPSPMQNIMQRLEACHGFEHPDWPRSEWRHEVQNNDTRLGYWEWVVHQIESAQHDQEAC